MGLFKMLEKVESKNLYIGEIFIVNSTGVLDGVEYVRSKSTTNQFAVVVKEDDKYFKDIDDSILYRKDWEIDNIHPFSEMYKFVTDKNVKAKITKREAVTIARKMTEERKREIEQGLEVK